MIRLHTFGGCFLARDGVRLDALSGQRKGLALLTLLAAAGARGVSRDALLAYLWPESDEERARTSLRQLVHALRSQLTAPDLVLSASELRLNPSVVASDVQDFRDALDRGDHAAAVGLYDGPFLEGFYLKNAADFERWATTERAALARDAARALERCAAQASARGDTRVAVDLQRRLAQADPLSARAAVGLMRALDAAGERAAALQYARVHEALVWDEVGAAPDQSVTALSDELRQAAPVAPLPPPTPPHERAAAPAVPTPTAAPAEVTEAVAVEPTAPAARVEQPRRARRPQRATVLLASASLVLIALLGARTWTRRDTPSAGTAGIAGTARRPANMGPQPSVAVLPFANTSGDPANEPLSDGLTDELISALGKVPGLKVAGRTSTFALKGKGLGVRAVGDTLGVAAVLEASVRRDGDRIKVTAQLVSTADNAILWSESYDRTLSDVISTQEDIARAIVAALRLTLNAPSGVTLVGRSAKDPTAYELYLRGRHIFYTRPDRDGALEAARYFTRAAARDPSYARAHAGLSDVHTRLAVFGFGRPREQYALAKAAARRALALDSTLAEAHTALAHALCVADFDWRAAERAFQRAVATDPGYTYARLPFAICLMSEGRFHEAAAHLDTARAADPLAPAPSNVLGRLHVSARQPDRAIRHLRDALELNPQMDLAYQQLGHAYLQQGRHAEAIAALRRAAALSGIRDSAHLAYAYAVTGRRTEAEAVVRSILDPATTRYVPPFHVAMAYAGLGDADAAFRWLERGYTERASFMIAVKVTPAFDPLHDDPRWASLLTRMGLVP